MSERILVTGATGYIGQHLVKSLGQAGYRVRAFSRQVETALPGVAEWHQGNITRSFQVRRALEGCQAVIHLACLPLGASLEKLGKAFHINAAGTFALLQAASERDNMQVVYTSTAQVYGPVTSLPLTEETPLQPTSPYAASKLCGEIACQSFARDAGLPVTVLRLFNVYGPAADGRERPTVETIFLKRLLAGRPPVISGNPQQGRDFIHVDDVVRCVQIVLEQAGAGEIINVGSGTLTTLGDLARRLAKLAGTRLQPIVKSNNEPPLQMQADMSKANELFGFQPQISLDEGLERLLASMQRIGADSTR